MDRREVGGGNVVKPPMPIPAAAAHVVVPTVAASPLTGLMARLAASDTAAFDALVRALQTPGLRLADRTLNTIAPVPRMWSRRR